MKVQELQALLAQCDPNATVTVEVNVVRNETRWFTGTESAHLSGVQEVGENGSILLHTSTRKHTGHWVGATPVKVTPVMRLDDLDSVPEVQHILQARAASWDHALPEPGYIPPAGEEERSDDR